MHPRLLWIFTIVVHKRYHHNEFSHFQDRFITRSVSINNKNGVVNNEVMILTYHRKQPVVEQGPSLCTARLTSQMTSKLTATYSLLWPIEIASGECMSWGPTEYICLADKE